jgi:hypothetical protein
MGLPRCASEDPGGDGGRWRDSIPSDLYLAGVSQMDDPEVTAGFPDSCLR